ncbi:MAG: hypothetical protein AAF959_30205, partial [Cyanobacteria bacterium P01_D01_bin.56]
GALPISCLKTYLSPELTVLLLEFVVLGKPVLIDDDWQLLDAWKQHVQKAARASIAARASMQLGSLPDIELSLQLTHYFDLPLGSKALMPDSKKLIAPIVDALQGNLYERVSQVVERTSSKRNLNSSFRIQQLSPTLAEGLYSGQEFVHAIIKGCNGS